MEEEQALSSTMPSGRKLPAQPCTAAMRIEKAAALYFPATDHVQCDSGRTLPTKRLHFAVEKASDRSSED